MILGFTDANIDKKCKTTLNQNSFFFFRILKSISALLVEIGFSQEKSIMIGYCGIRSKA